MRALSDVVGLDLEKGWSADTPCCQTQGGRARPPSECVIRCLKEPEHDIGQNSHTLWNLEATGAPMSANEEVIVGTPTRTYLSISRSFPREGSRSSPSLSLQTERIQITVIERAKTDKKTGPYHLRADLPIALGVPKTERTCSRRDCLRKAEIGIL